MPKDFSHSKVSVFVTQDGVAGGITKVDVDFSYSQPFLTITVTDDGKGFTAQDRAEAVSCFYKGTKEKEHFGIGLTICKILAEKHGGSLFLDNAPEGGARVSVELEIK